MDPQIGAHPFLDAIDDHAADMIHVHVSEDHVGHRRKFDPGGLEALDRATSLRQFEVRVEPQAEVDEDSLRTAPYHVDVERPLSHVPRQKLIVEPRTHTTEQKLEAT